MRERDLAGWRRQGDEFRRTEQSADSSHSRGPASTRSPRRPDGNARAHSARGNAARARGAQGPGSYVLADAPLDTVTELLEQAGHAPADAAGRHLVMLRDGAMAAVAARENPAGARRRDALAG